MVMLIMVLLVAMAVVRLTLRHTQVVNNEQVRAESEAAANYALDMVLNSPATTWDAYKGTGTTRYVNAGTITTVDTTEASVAVAVSGMTCRRSRIIKNSELIKSRVVGSETVAYVSAEDSSCFGGGGSPITIVNTDSTGTTSGNSLCATVLYQVQARTDDAKLLGASTTVVQGAEVRRSVDELGACD
jgi:archaellum component FlaG (FlaF/FlaG flagellin family)